MKDKFLPKNLIRQIKLLPQINFDDKVINQYSGAHNGTREPWETRKLGE